MKTDVNLLLHSAQIKADALSESIIQECKEHLDETNSRLRKYMDENNLKGNDVMTYEHFLQLNDITSKATLNAIEDILPHSLATAFADVFTFYGCPQTDE